MVRRGFHKKGWKKLRMAKSKAKASDLKGIELTGNAELECDGQERQRKGEIFSNNDVTYFYCPGDLIAFPINPPEHWCQPSIFLFWIRSLRLLKLLDSFLYFSFSLSSDARERRRFAAALSRLPPALTSKRCVPPRCFQNELRVQCLCNRLNIERKM